jgi:hypothetical protein
LRAGTLVVFENLERKFMGVHLEIERPMAFVPSLTFDAFAHAARFGNVIPISVAVAAPATSVLRR